MSIKTRLLGLASRTGVILKQKSPIIMIGAGIVLGVTACVVACRAVPEATKIREECNKAIDDTEKVLNDPEHPEYTEESAMKDLRIISRHRALGYIRKFGLAVLIGMASVACFIFSHKIMARRNAELLASMAALTEAFRNYRNEVACRLGEEVDAEIASGRRKVEVVDSETGEKKTKFVTTTPGSPYARLYAEGSRGWVPDADANRLTLNCQQAFANQRLREKGYVFLNEIYQMLGMPESKAGHHMGWIYYKNPEENTYGDNEIRFGHDKKWDFEAGLERNVWLDFNVDLKPIDDRIRWLKY